jgi:Lrp/AsnC family leucine-responsive transcriptional regulator
MAMAVPICTAPVRSIDVAMMKILDACAAGGAGVLFENRLSQPDPWFHMETMWSFGEVSFFSIQKMRNDLNLPAPGVDGVDQRLITLLSGNARMTVADLARQVGMSSPSVADRLRRLEESGVIRRYTVEVDAAALGYALEAIVRVRPLPGQLRRVEQLLADIPEFIECDKVTGDDCFVARVVLRTIGHLDQILERVTEYAETNTAIIKAATLRRRLPPLG